MLIRDATSDDLPRLLEIYNHYVVHTPISFDIEPVDPANRLDTWFPHYGDSGRYRLLVATIGDLAIGYASSSRFHMRAAYATSVETSVYVDKDYLGKGVGTKLYAALFEALKGTDVHRAYGGITLPNEASMALHKRFGFREIGTYSEVGFKFERYFDVCWLEKRISR